MNVPVSALIFAGVAGGAFVFRGAKAFLAAARFLLAGAAFFTADRGLRTLVAFFAAFLTAFLAVFLAAGRDFRVFAAFFATDFLEADFDLAMFPTPPQSA
jgi:hypothetical protein